jgi:hypothetical protein
MNATILDHDPASDMPQRSELGTPMPQKPKAPIKARSAKWLVACCVPPRLPSTPFGVDWGTAARTLLRIGELGKFRAGEGRGRNRTVRHGGP